MSSQIILIVPILYVALQWAALHRMRDGWHIAALLPALVMAVALLFMVVGLIASADLALLALMIGLPLATIYLIVLWPLHLMLGRHG